MLSLQNTTKWKLKPERLEGDECCRLRPLWEEVFYEDTKEFTDYYFREKAARNHGYVLKDEEGVMAAMLYLSPYPVMLRRGKSFVCREINYIVGVATKEKYRHRGCMDRLLRAALQDMYEERQPFAFLMPADPAIYRPYQFAYIYDRPEYRLEEGEVRRNGGDMEPGQEEKGNKPVKVMTEAGSRSLSELAGFAQGYLERHYDVFIRRDEDYYRIMEKELQAQRGGICLTEEGGRIKGFFLYTQEKEGVEIQEAVWDGGNSGRNCPVSETGVQTPIIMARAVNVQAMLSLLWAEGGEIALDIRVSDPILEANNGIWGCIFTEEGAKVQKYKEHKNGRKEPGGRKRAELAAASVDQERLAEAEISVDGLVSWAFGYREAGECFHFREEAGEEEKGRVLHRLHKVKRPGKVWINEII